MREGGGGVCVGLGGILGHHPNGCWQVQWGPPQALSAPPPPGFISIFHGREEGTRLFWGVGSFPCRRDRWGPHLAQWGCKQHRGRGAWHPAADIPPNAPRAPPATRMTPWGTTTLGVLRVPCRIPGVQTLWEHPGQKFPQHSRAETLGTASSSPRDCMASRAQPGEPWRRAWGYG